jgi:uncharacterized protein YecT (DUF1311 family)
MAGLAAASWVCAAAAQEPTYSPEVQQCLNTSTNWSTPGMVACWNAERARLEAELDRTYRATLAAARPESQGSLRASQETWGRYRDVNCAAWAEISGGTIDQVNEAACLVRLTAQRVIELADMRNY